MPDHTPATTVPDLVARRELWPIPDAAHRLGINKRTLWRRIEAGAIKATRDGGRTFISNRELSRYLDQLESNGE